MIEAPSHTTDCLGLCQRAENLLTKVEGSKLDSLKASVKRLLVSGIHRCLSLTYQLSDFSKRCLGFSASHMPSLVERDEMAFVNGNVIVLSIGPNSYDEKMPILNRGARTVVIRSRSLFHDIVIRSLGAWAIKTTKRERSRLDGGSLIHRPSFGRLSRQTDSIKSHFLCQGGIANA